MKTLTRWTATAAVLCIGGVSLAADCQNSGPRAMYYRSNTAPYARYSYRSGYQGMLQPAAPLMTGAPARTYVGPYGYVYSGPEAQLEYARVRQHIRGW